MSCSDIKIESECSNIPVCEYDVSASKCNMRQNYLNTFDISCSILNNFKNFCDIIPKCIYINKKCDDKTNLIKNYINDENELKDIDIKSKNIHNELEKQINNLIVEDESIDKYIDSLDDTTKQINDDQDDLNDRIKTRSRMINVLEEKNIYKQKVIFTLVSLIFFLIIMIIFVYVFLSKR